MRLEGDMDKYIDLGIHPIVFAKKDLTIDEAIELERALNNI